MCSKFCSFLDRGLTSLRICHRHVRYRITERYRRQIRLRVAATVSFGIKLNVRHQEEPYLKFCYSPVNFVCCDVTMLMFRIAVLILVRSNRQLTTVRIYPWTGRAVRLFGTIAGGNDFTENTKGYRQIYIAACQSTRASMHNILRSYISIVSILVFDW